MDYTTERSIKYEVLKKKLFIYDGQNSTVKKLMMRQSICLSQQQQQQHWLVMLTRTGAHSLVFLGDMFTMNLDPSTKLGPGLSQVGYHGLLLICESSTEKLDVCNVPGNVASQQEGIFQSQFSSNSANKGSIEKFHVASDEEDNPVPSLRVV